MSRAKQKLDKIAGYILICFPIILGWQFQLSYNEADVVALALHFADSHWAQGDWYLGLPSEYRTLFNGLIGYPISWMGPEIGLPFVRALLLLSFGWVSYLISKVGRIHPVLMMLALFFLIRNQSFLAEEWIFGGVETKALSYLFLLGGIIAMDQRKPLLLGLSGGLALSFHILIGFYGGLIIIALLILQRNALRELWGKWMQMLTAAIIGGAYGFFYIIKTLTKASVDNADHAWDLYVNFRVPHHVSPSDFPPEGWWYFGIAIFIILISRVWILNEFLKRLRLFALCSLVFVAIGLVINWSGNTLSLRYYWFRLPDAIIPFTAFVLTASLLSELLAKSKYLYRQIIVGALSTLILISTIIQLRDRWELVQGVPVWSIDWITENTDSEDVFLINPAQTTFYFNQNRAQFVSFKHFPQEAGAILEWERRLKRCAGGNWPSSRGFNFRKDIKKSYFGLESEEIRKICLEEGLTYALFPKKIGIKKDLPVAFQNNKQVIYGPFE